MELRKVGTRISILKLITVRDDRDYLRLKRGIKGGQYRNFCGETYEREVAGIEAEIRNEKGLSLV